MYVACLNTYMHSQVTLISVCQKTFVMSHGFIMLKMLNIDNLCYKHVPIKINTKLDLWVGKQTLCIST